MKPVLQTDDYPYGNCLSACLASLFEVDLEEVPNFFRVAGQDQTAWWAAVREWLRPRGFGIMSLEIRDLALLANFEGWMIVSGQSRPGVYHATIWREGNLVHDPHPLKPGISEPESVDMLYPLDPAALMLR